MADIYHKDLTGEDLHIPKEHGNEKHSATFLETCDKHTKVLHDALALDHGELTGLADDDHTQYYNATRHTKAIHDALNINADKVDNCDAGVATGNIFKLPAGLTHGDIFYVNTSGNVIRLGYGTSGHFLKTQGAGANPIWAAGAGGVTDHGALTGLADDDHSQYYNSARHTKAIHDSLAINAGQVDGCDAGVATGNIFKLPAGLTHGDIFYVNTSGNVIRLGYGTSGHFLKTQGAGANPIWAAGAGGVTDHGALTGLADDDHSQYYNSARHTKAIHDSLAINAGQVDGCDAGVATGNVFKLPVSLTHGDLFYINSSGNVVRLPAGTSNYFLKTQGSGANPIWTAHDKALHDALTLDHGVLTGLADDDHSQYYNATRHTKAIHDSLNINADKVDNCDAGVVTGNVFKLPAGLTQGDIFYINSAGNVVRLPAGTSSYFLKTQGAGANPIWTAHDKALHDALTLDHGVLTGLADDDHSQYYNATRHTKAIHDSLNIDAAKLESSTKAQVRDHAPASHGVDKHTNVTRKFFIPAMSGYTTGEVSLRGKVAVIHLDADTDQVVNVTFKVPNDYASGGTISFLCTDGLTANGNIIWDAELAHATDGEFYTINSSTDMSNTLTIDYGTKFRVISTTLSFTALSKEDFVSILFRRDANNVNDDLPAPFAIVGFIFEYTAEQ